MPQRPDNHIIADIALSNVMHICTQCGWACEVVHKDYGDDILVQTTYNGMVDHSRIWIQVKGTRDIDQFYSKKYGYSMKVSLDHALKWVRSSDLVVVVMWDVERNYGLWSIPKEHVDEWDYYSLSDKKSRLIFGEKALFNIESAMKIGWKARISHYASLLNNALDRDIDDQNFPKHDSNIELQKKRAPLIAFDFLRLLGIFDYSSDRDLLFLNKDFLKFIEDALNVVVADMEEDPPITDEEIEAMAVVLAIITRCTDVTKGVGIPTTLLVNCADAVMTLLELHYQKISDQ